MHRQQSRAPKVATAATRPVPCGTLTTQRWLALPCPTRPVPSGTLTTQRWLALPCPTRPVTSGTLTTQRWLALPCPTRPTHPPTPDFTRYRQPEVSALPVATVEAAWAGMAAAAATSAALRDGVEGRRGEMPLGVRTAKCRRISHPRFAGHGQGAALRVTAAGPLTKAALQQQQPSVAGAWIRGRWMARPCAFRASPDG